MNESKHSNRIPFEDIDSSAAWDFPSWDEGAKVVPSAKKKPAQEEPAGRVEDVAQEDQHNIAPITAAQLQQMSEDAEREGREHGYTQGYEQGFSEGEQKGLKLGEQKAYAEVKQRLDEQRERFCQLADALLDPVAMQDAGLENLLLDMAVHFAKHLLNKELSEDPSAMFETVKCATASLPAGAQNVRIYLHADDVELAHEAFAGGGRDWRFYADAQLSRGGCRIETSESLIDFSVERRLQQMLDEVNFQGEIDPDSLPPVADYRAPQNPESRVSAEQREPTSLDATQQGEQEPQTHSEETAMDADNSAPAPAPETPAGEGAQQNNPGNQAGPAAADANPSVAGQANSGESASSAPQHSYGNPWDGRRE